PDEHHAGRPVRDSDLRSLVPHTSRPDARRTRGHPSRDRGSRDLMKTFFKVLRRAVEWTAIILVTIVIIRAVGARRLPDLKPWHRYVPHREVTAAELTDRFTLAEYRAREDEIWQEIRDHVESNLAPEYQFATNRYYLGARNNPDRFPTDWNHTFEL